MVCAEDTDEQRAGMVGEQASPKPRRFVALLHLGKHDQRSPTSDMRNPARLSAQTHSRTVAVPRAHASSLGDRPKVAITASAEIARAREICRT